jgi:glycosyltransferase involved in cell wall biosynthesis
MKIILDCDLMKYPNSGLYHYCLNLGRQVNKLLDKQSGEQISFYGPAIERKTFRDTGPYYPERNRFWNFFNPFPRRCDIWHAPFQSGRIIPDRNKHRKTKVLLTIHDLNPLHEGKPVSEQKKSLLHTQSLIDNSDAIVCISEFCKKDVLKFCRVASRPVFVIHNGSHQVGAPRLEPGSVRPAKPFLFGMGYINRKKNYHVIVPLLEDNGIEMVLAGRLDEPDYVERLKAEARKIGAEDRLHITGPVTEGEKSWYYQHCMAFVHPSLAEGFGAPVVEAMQFGKPLFISALTSLPEIAGSAAYYFKSFEPQEIRRTFSQGMYEFGLNGMAQKIVNKGREYNWEEKAKQYLEVYRELHKNIPHAR